MTVHQPTAARNVPAKTQAEKCARIPLSKNACALIDMDCFEEINTAKWSLSSEGYAIRSIARPQRGVMYMHRQIMAAETGQIVDHVNGDKLDNRLHNLRFVSKRENAVNSRPAKNKRTSIYKGVHRVFIMGTPRPWCTQITRDSKKIHIGRFASEAEAAKAYDVAALAEYGLAARLNFPMVAK